jgi:hypothetical protein
VTWLKDPQAPPRLEIVVLRDGVRSYCFDVTDDIYFDVKCSAPSPTSVRRWTLRFSGHATMAAIESPIRCSSREC